MTNISAKNPAGSVNNNNDDYAYKPISIEPKKELFGVAAEGPVDKFFKTLGKMFILSGCGDDDGGGNNSHVNNNNNNNHNDAGIDGAVDSGDAVVPTDADASVECVDSSPILSGVPLTVDSYQCTPVDIDYHAATDKLLAVCAYPINRLITVAPRNNNQVATLAEFWIGPNQDEQVQPQSLYAFSAYSRDLIAVPYQYSVPQHPTYEYGAIRLFDHATGAELDDQPLAFQFNFGSGVQDVLINNPRGAMFYASANGVANSRLFVTSEHKNELGSYVPSLIPGFPFEQIGQAVYFDVTVPPAIALPDGYRTAGITKLADEKLVMAVGGVAGATPAEDGKLVIMDPTTGAAFTRITSSIPLGLLPGEQLIGFPELAKVGDNNFIMVATDGVEPHPQQRVLVVHTEANGTSSIHDIDLTTIANGTVTDIVVEASLNRVYLIDKGNGAQEPGRVITLDIDPATGATTMAGSTVVGINPSKAELDLGVSPAKLYVHVEQRVDCKAVNAQDTGPQLVIIDTSKIQ
jgi:hypothetical protein